MTEIYNDDRLTTKIYNLLIYDTAEHFIQDVRNKLRMLRTEDILVRHIIVDPKLGRHECNFSPFSKEFENIVNIAYEDKFKGHFIALYFDKNTSGIYCIYSFKYYFDLQQSFLTIDSTTLSHFVEFDRIGEDRGLFCSAKEKEYFSLIDYKPNAWKKLTIEERQKLLSLFERELSDMITYKVKRKDDGSLSGRKKRYINARNKLFAKPELKKQFFDLIKSSNTSVFQWFGVMYALRTLVFSAKK